MNILAKFDYDCPLDFTNGKSRCIFSGRFNPLHNGHLAVAHYIEKMLHRKTLFEIPLNNPKMSQTNKLVISDNLGSIINQFKLMSRNVVLTDTVSYAMKAKLFKNCIFILGPEVLARITDPVNYFNSIQELIRHMDIIRDNGCRFLVFPRTAEQAIYNMKVPKYIEDITTFVQDFNPIEVSSTEIRKELEKLNPPTEKAAK